jgi:tellurite resistance protein
MNPVTLALAVSAAGMVIVFAAICLLWAVITLLVYLTRKRTMQEVIISEAELQRKRRAAIAAITIALAMELDTQPHEFPISTPTQVSPWQAVMRSNMLNKRGPK